MKKRFVFIEICGKRYLAGSISGEAAESARFAYDPDYLRDPDAAPVSVRFPLREEPFSPMETRCFFEGLLPGGFLRRCAAVWVQADRADYLSLLENFGADCPGAIQVTDAVRGISAKDDDPERLFPDAGSYEPLSEKDLQRLTTEGATMAAEYLAKTHTTIGGADGKVGLSRDEDGAWYLPMDGAPGTHILKQSHVRLEQTVENELLVLRTAKKLGIPTVQADMLGGPLLVTARYDRRGRGGRMPGWQSDGNAQLPGEAQRSLPRPQRLHQENMAQALGIPGQLCDEPEEGAYLRRMFELLCAFSADPIADRAALWDRVVFHTLIGNTEGHIKSCSLLYREDLRAPRLAPLVGSRCTTLYGGAAMAFHIGGERELAQLTREHFARAAAEAGLGKGQARDRVHELWERFPVALAAAAGELQLEGCAAAPELARSILAARPHIW